MYKLIFILLLLCSNAHASYNMIVVDDFQTIVPGHNKSHGDIVSDLAVAANPNTRVKKVPIPESYLYLAGILYDLPNDRKIVVNMSFNSSDKKMRCDTTMFQSAVHYANKKGHKIVVSAGNDASESLTFPANCEGVFVVGVYANYSNYTDSVIMVNEALYNEEIIHGTSFGAPVFAASLVSSSIGEQAHVQGDQEKTPNSLCSSDLVGSICKLFNID